MLASASPFCMWPRTMSRSSRNVMLIGIVAKYAVRSVETVAEGVVDSPGTAHHVETSVVFPESEFRGVRRGRLVTGMYQLRVSCPSVIS